MKDRAYIIGLDATYITRCNNGQKYTEASSYEPITSMDGPVGSPQVCEKPCAHDNYDNSYRRKKSTSRTKKIGRVRRGTHSLKIHTTVTDQLMIYLKSVPPQKNVSCSGNIKDMLPHTSLFISI